MDGERFNELLVEQYKLGKEHYYWHKLMLIPSIVSNGYLIEYHVNVSGDDRLQNIHGFGNSFEEAVADVRRRWIARVDEAFDVGFLVFNDRA